MADTPLQIIVGRVIEITDHYIVVEPGVRVEVSDRGSDQLVIGRRVTVRAVRQGHRMIAESIALEHAV